MVPNHISQLHSNHISKKLILNPVPGVLTSRDQEEAARRQQELARQFQEVGSLLLALMIIMVIMVALMIVVRKVETTQPFSQ